LEPHVDFKDFPLLNIDDGIFLGVNNRVLLVSSILLFWNRRGLFWCMVIIGDIKSKGNFLAEIISLLASFERERVGVLSFFSRGFQVDAIDSEKSLGLDCPYVNLQCL